MPVTILLRAFFILDLKRYRKVSLQPGSSGLGLASSKRGEVQATATPCTLKGSPRMKDFAVRHPFQFGILVTLAAGLGQIWPLWIPGVSQAVQILLARASDNAIAFFLLSWLHWWQESGFTRIRSWKILLPYLPLILLVLLSLASVIGTAGASPGQSWTAHRGVETRRAESRSPRAGPPGPVHGSARLPKGPHHPDGAKDRSSACAYFYHKSAIIFPGTFSKLKW